MSVYRRGFLLYWLALHDAIGISLTRVGIRGEARAVRVERSW